MLAPVLFIGKLLWTNRQTFLSVETKKACDMIPVEYLDHEQKIGTTLVLIHEQEWYYMYCEHSAVGGTKLCCYLGQC